MKKLKLTKKKLIALVAVILILVLIITMAVSAGGGSSYQEMAVSERDIVSYLEFSGNIEASETSTLYSKVGAQVVEVKVEEGDQVEAGDVIAVLDSDDVEYNIALQEENLKQSELTDSYNIKDSQTSLDQLNEQLSQGLNSTLNASQTTLLQAQESYQSAVESYNKAKAELEAGTTDSVVTARQNLSSAQASYDSAVAQHDAMMITDEALATYAVTLSNAQETYDNAVEAAEQEVQDYYDAMVTAEETLADAERDYQTAELSVDQNVENTEDSLERTQALASQESTRMEIEHLKESLEDYTIAAPISGYVTSLSVDAGDFVTSAGQVAVVTSFDTMQASVKINEYDVAQVKEGDSVQVHVNALNKDYEGTIASIAKEATVENDVSYLDAVVEFAADDEIRGGLSAEIRLIKEQATGVPALPENVISYDTDNTAYVYIRGEGGKETKQQVTLGVSDGTWVEITDGLSVGDTILYQPQPSYAAMPAMAAQ